MRVDSGPVPLENRIRPLACGFVLASGGSVVFVDQDRTRASHVPARRLLSVVHEFAEEGDALLGSWLRRYQFCRDDDSAARAHVQRVGGQYIDQYFELVLQFVAPNGMVRPSPTLGGSPRQRRSCETGFAATS